MRRRFFIDRFSGDLAILEGPAAHHLARVLRARPGQLYELSDGKTVRLGRVESVRRDSVRFVLLDAVPARANSFHATLLLALVKFDRFEWALEKAAELGASRIVPLAAARSEKALITASEKRAARWRKILSESAQQARCLRPPELGATVSPAVGFQTCQADLRILLSERPAAGPLRPALEAAMAPPHSARPERMALAIGPEGGWTDAEFAQAEAAGFREASLGANILRTETAVAAALAAVHLYFDAI